MQFVAPRTRISSRRSWLNSDTLAGYIFIAPAILGFSIFVVYPMITAAYLSLTNWNGLTDPQFIGFKNFIDLFTKDPSFWPAIKATLVYAILTVPTTLVVGLLLALLLNRNLPGMRIFRTLLYLPVVLPVVAALTLWKFIYDPQVGLANLLLSVLHLPTSLWLSGENTALPSIALVTLWGVGSTMIIFLAGLQTVPNELYEAAKIDGANQFTTFFRLTLPMISPILLLQLILQLNAAMQVFNQVKILTAGTGGPGASGTGGPGFSTNVLMLSIYNHGFGRLGSLPELGYATAQVWVLFTIVIVITMFTFRFSSFWVYSENSVN